MNTHTPLIHDLVQTPFGTYAITADQHSLLSLRPLPNAPDIPTPHLIHPIIHQAKLWLRRYFDHQAPSPRELPLNPQGTPFQQQTWNLLLDIPYGQTTTYGQIARQLLPLLNHTISPQAVGHAIGQNPIRIIIPCHRVIAQNGNLTGYADGIPLKKRLLQHENAILTLP